MTPRLTNVGEDEVAACPECDVAGEVWKRTHPNRDYDKAFKCHKCGAEFDAANRRPPKASPVVTGEDGDGLPHNLKPKAKRLIRANRGD